MSAIHALPGGGQFAITTTPVAVDLSALAGMEVLIWSDDDDIWFSAATDGTSTALVISGDSAASKSSLKGDRSAKSVGKLRVIHPRFPYLVVRANSGSGTLHVKCTQENAHG